MRVPDRPGEVWLRRRPLGLAIGIGLVWAFALSIVLLAAVGLINAALEGRPVLTWATAVFLAAITTLATTALLLARHWASARDEQGVVLDVSSLRYRVGRTRGEVPLVDLVEWELEHVREGFVLLGYLIGGISGAFAAHGMTKDGPKGTPSRLLLRLRDGSRREVPLQAFHPDDIHAWAARARQDGPAAWRAAWSNPPAVRAANPAR